MISLRFITVGQLTAFIESPQYLQSEVVPISPQRAHSQAHNPQAAPDDIALILAYDEKNILCGYLGILPDMVQNQKVAWLSCIWVDNRVRGQGIAKKLVVAAEKAYPNRLLLTQFTPAAHQLYIKLNLFADFARPEGLRCYLRADLQTILPNKKPFLRYFRPFLATFDTVANTILSPFSYFKQRRNQQQLQNIKIKYHTYLPPHISQYIKYFDIKDFDIKDFAENEGRLSWIYNYPWLLSAPLPDDNSQKYHFSSVEKSFACVMVELSEKNEAGQDKTIAFFMLNHRKNLLKIPYLYANPAAAPNVLAFISQYMQKEKLATFLCFQPALLAALKAQNFGFFSQKKQRHHYMASKELLTLVDYNQIHWQDGAGDAAFT